VTCKFCQIAQSEVPAHVVISDDISLGFLDRRPLFPGHCLLIPKVHIETLADLPFDLIAPLFRNVQILSKALEEALNAEGTLVAINNRVSQSVPHLHIHIVPRRRKDGLKGFFWPRNPYPNEETAAKIQASIQAAIQELLAPVGKMVHLNDAEKPSSSARQGSEAT
jgi:histidine triad (HIT) family protein